MQVVRSKTFKNGTVYAIKTNDGFPIEVTDTFLPYYTKFCVGRANKMKDVDLGSRSERFMVGVSTMSGCPVGCKFCATGSLSKCRNLTANEIISQVAFVIKQNSEYRVQDAKEFKINYTRMGEPFLNLEDVRLAITRIDKLFPGCVHHYVSTIGIKGSDFSWVKDNITLQVSLHSLDEKRRDELIPMDGKMSIEELGQIRTQSNLKTTVNLTLVDEKDFDIERLKKYFDPKYFFIKLSPINPNDVSEANGLGLGVIEAVNLV
jgi:23S rRNA (adenine2503-C2)-methyltransferase